MHLRLASSRSEVYPRVCGGTTMRDMKPGAITTRVYPPRVRGNQKKMSRCANLRRSIPACAGEPHVPKKAEILSEVYPRVCGGTATIPNHCLRLFR